MNNNRREQRKHLYYYVDILDSGTGQPLGKVVDITTGGLKLITEKAMPVDVEFSLSLRVSEIYEEKDDIVVKAKTLWSRSDVNVDYFDTGFEFLDVDDDTKIRIKNLINRCSFAD